MEARGSGLLGYPSSCCSGSAGRAAPDHASMAASLARDAACDTRLASRAPYARCAARMRLVAGVGIVIHSLACRCSTRPLRLFQLLAAASCLRLNEARTGRRTHSHSVLHDLVEARSRLPQRATQRSRPAAAPAGSGSAVRNSDRPVVVHAYPTAQPAIGIVALAQPCQSSGAPYTLAGRKQPQRHL